MSLRHRPRKRHVPATPPHLGTPQILLIDDSEEALDLMSQVLEQEGFTSFGVSSGPGALEYLEKYPAPLCLFVDFDMPGMDGLEFVDVIRTRYGDDLVLIAITGSFDKDTQRLNEFCRRVDHHFAKPVNWPKLSRILSALH